MKKHTLTKLVALTMAGTLLISPLTAFGADPSTNDDGISVSANGTGSTVGSVDKEIYKVVLPTDAGGTFDYFVDPQDLLNQSADVTSTVSGNLLYFKDGTDYNSTSADLTVTNKSSVPVDITVTASTDADADDPDVTLAEDDTFAGAPAQSIYLSLNVTADGTTDQKALAAGTETAITKTLGDAAEYYNVAGTEGAFTYELDDDPSNTYDELSFNLSGACNASDEWAADAVLPTVHLVWGFEKGEDGVSDGPLTVTRSGLVTLTTNGPGSVALSFGSPDTPNKTYPIQSPTHGTLDLTGYNASTGIGEFKFQFGDVLLDPWRESQTPVVVYATYGANKYSVTITF